MATTTQQGSAWAHVPWATAGLMVLMLVSLSGCDQTAAERDRRVAVEQQAIVQYSAKVPDADRHQGAFADEWRKINELKELKAYKAGMATKVLPALETYVAVLKMMPAQTEDLKRIHGLMTEGYDDAVVAFKAFLADLDDSNVEAKYRVLLEAMEKVSHAERRYQKDLATYYAKNRVQMSAADTGSGRASEGEPAPSPTPNGEAAPSPSP